MTARQPHDSNYQADEVNPIDRHSKAAKAFSMTGTVFGSRSREEGHEKYVALVPKISGCAKGIPRHLSRKSFVAEDSERVTVIEFKYHQSQIAWATQQDLCGSEEKRTREYLYAEHTIQVCQVLREATLAAPKQGPVA